MAVATRGLTLVTYTSAVLRRCGCNGLRNSALARKSGSVGKIQERCCRGLSASWSSQRRTAWAAARPSPAGRAQRIGPAMCVPRPGAGPSPGRCASWSGRALRAGRPAPASAVGTRSCARRPSSSAARARRQPGLSGGPEQRAWRADRSAEADHRQAAARPARRDGAHTAWPDTDRAGGACVKACRTAREGLCGCGDLRRVPGVPHVRWWDLPCAFRAAEDVS